MLLSHGGRFQLENGDRLRFGDVDASIEDKSATEDDDDVLVPDSQPIDDDDGRKSSTKIAADVSAQWNQVLSLSLAECHESA